MSVGGGNGKCIFIDTQGTFRTDRIVSITTRFNYDIETALDQITCVRVYSSDQLICVLFQRSALMAQTKYSLLIIDNAIILFRREYSNVADIQKRPRNLA